MLIHRGREQTTVGYTVIDAFTIVLMFLLVSLCPVHDSAHTLTANQTKNQVKFCTLFIYVIRIKIKSLHVSSTYLSVIGFHIYLDL